MTFKIPDRRPLQIENANKRVTATQYRDDMEDCLSLQTEKLIRFAHSEGLLYELLIRVGWQSGRCSCGCEEARFGDRPHYHLK